MVSNEFVPTVGRPSILPRNPAAERAMWFADDGSYNEVRGLASFVARLAPAGLRPIGGDWALAAQRDLGWIAAIHTPCGRLSVELTQDSASLPALLRLDDYLDDCRYVVTRVFLIRRAADGGTTTDQLSLDAARAAVRRLAVGRANHAHRSTGGCLT